MINKQTPDLDLIKIYQTSENHEERIEARDILWNRYYHFTEKAFFQWRQSIVDSGMEMHDFIGEAFDRFLYALNNFDLSNKSVNKFGTYYYYALFDVKNKCDNDIKKRVNKTTYFSYYDKNDCDMSVEDYDNEINNVLQVDFETQREKRLASEIISEYRRIESDPDKLEMLNMLLEGCSTNKIVTTFSKKMNAYQVKKRIKSLFSKVQDIAIANYY